MCIRDRLKTLILEGTQIKDEFLGTADWENTNIIELNVLSCYRLSFSGLSAVLPKLRRLRYLKCELTDEMDDEEMKWTAFRC